MLVLTRKVDEKIIIGDTITITVVAVRGNTVRLGIDAPRSIPVYREEIYVAIQKERAMKEQELKDSPSADSTPEPTST